MFEEMLKKIAVDKKVIKAHLAAYSRDEPWPKALMLIFEDGSAISCRVEHASIRKPDGSGIEGPT